MKYFEVVPGGIREVSEEAEVTHTQFFGENISRVKKALSSLTFYPMSEIPKEWEGRRDIEPKVHFNFQVWVATLVGHWWSCSEETYSKYPEDQRRIKPIALPIQQPTDSQESQQQLWEEVLTIAYTYARHNPKEQLSQHFTLTRKV